MREAHSTLTSRVPT